MKEMRGGERLSNVGTREEHSRQTEYKYKDLRSEHHFQKIATGRIRVCERKSSRIAIREGEGVVMQD